MSGDHAANKAGTDRHGEGGARGNGEAHMSSPASAQVRLSIPPPPSVSTSGVSSTDATVVATAKGPGAAVENTSATQSLSREGQEVEAADDDDFFALLSRAKDVHRNKDARWSIEHDEMSDGPSPAELAAMPEPERWKLHFRHLLSSEAGVESFRKFLKTIVAQENIEFWVECSGLATLESSPAKMASACASIYDKYLRPSAHRAINITGETRASVNANMDAKNFSRYTFAAAQKEVYFLMKRDSYPKYLDSDAYAKIVRTWSTSKRRSKGTPQQSASAESSPGESFKRSRFFSKKIPKNS